jgi:hypothetical protein
MRNYLLTAALMVAYSYLYHVIAYKSLNPTEIILSIHLQSVALIIHWWVSKFAVPMIDEKITGARRSTKKTLESVVKKL